MFETTTWYISEEGYKYHYSGFFNSFSVQGRTDSGQWQEKWQKKTTHETLSIPNTTKNVPLHITITRSPTLDHYCHRQQKQQQHFASTAILP